MQSFHQVTFFSFCLFDFIGSEQNKILDDKYIAIQGIGGSIMVLCGISKQLLFTLQINGEVRTMSFSHDSTVLYATGGLKKWLVGFFFFFFF